MIQLFHSVVARMRAGGGGPTLIASDDFSWATSPVAIDTDPDWTITNGVFIAVSGVAQADLNSTTSIAYFDTVAALVNQRVEVTLKAFSGAFIGAACRVVDANNHWYAITDGSVMYAGVVVAGTPTNFVNGDSIAYSVNDKLAMEVTGTGSGTIVTIQRYTGGSWSNVYSGDPGTYMDTAGYPGLAGYSNGSQCDDFAAYSL